MLELAVLYCIGLYQVELIYYPIRSTISQMTNKAGEHTPESIGTSNMATREVW